MMETKTYECTPGFGWGVRGQAQSGIRAQARRLGLAIEPFQFAQLHEMVAPVRVSVRGDPDAVDAFAAWMRQMGYDDRPTLAPPESSPEG